MSLNALTEHRPSAKAWPGRNSIPCIPMASGLQTCYRRVCSSTTGHWDSGNPALTVSRRRCGTKPDTSSDSSRFPTRLLSPRPFGSREGGRLRVICLELWPPPGAIHSVRTMAHAFTRTRLSTCRSSFVTRSFRCISPTFIGDSSMLAFGLSAHENPNKLWPFALYEAFPRSVSGSLLPPTTMAPPTLPVQAAWSHDCSRLRALVDYSPSHPAGSLPRSRH